MSCGISQEVKDESSVRAIGQTMDQRLRQALVSIEASVWDAMDDAHYAGRALQASRDGEKPQRQGEPALNCAVTKQANEVIDKLKLELTALENEGERLRALLRICVNCMADLGCAGCGHEAEKIALIGRDDDPEDE